MTAPSNASTALATVVLDELVRSGLRHLVLCPGSRSAALAFAAHAFDAEGRLTLHTRIDERSAAFLALGLARTSRTPVAVVTTSGTAAANLHPAVLEAHHSGVPLVLLTADRPADLRGTGANQTTLQAPLFGSAVLLAADVPAPVPGHREAAQAAGWRALVARAALTATGAAGAGARGPVHLNLQLAEPFTPDVADGWSDPADGRAGNAPWTRPAAPLRATVEELPDADPGDADPGDAAPGDAERRPRTVVVAGDDAGPPARVLAQQRGWPLLAEPTSGSRTGPNAIRTYRLLLADDDLAGRVERVVVCGHPTLSRPVTRLLSRADVEVVALVPPGSPTGRWTDPGHRVSRVLGAVAGAHDGRPAGGWDSSVELPTDAWLEEWRSRDAAVSQRLDALLAERESLAPQQVAGAVAAALPPGGLLFVGASNPVRDLDLMVPRYRVGDRRMVVGNRGLAGIDGTVSSAIGAALGRPRSTRSLALLGDVTFLHDLTGLVLGPQEPRPDLTLVVVNDDGGSIFASLEQGAPAHAAAFERVFATPHHADLAAVCAATGVRHTRVETAAALEAALADPAAGLHVVEAVVSRHDRRELDAAVRALG